MDERQQRFIGAGAGVLAVISALLPWLSIDVGLAELTFSGIDEPNDGEGTLILGAAAVPLFLVGGRWLIGSVIAGSGIIAIAADDLADVLRANEVMIFDEGLAGASVGIGLWLTLIAGVAITVLAAYPLWKAFERSPLPLHSNAATYQRTSAPPRSTPPAPPRSAPPANQHPRSPPHQ